MIGTTAFVTRYAHAADFDIIGQILCSRPNARNLEHQMRALKRIVIVAVRNHDEPVGFVAISQKNNAVRIEMIAVWADFRNQGVGRSLIRKLQKLARTYGGDVGIVCTVDANDPVIKGLLEKSGFKIAGVSAGDTRWVYLWETRE